MFEEKVIRNRKIFLEKLGYDSSWITKETIPNKDFENHIKQLIKRKPKGRGKTYLEMSYPIQVGGYSLSTTSLQTIVNRERRRYGL